MRVLVIVIVTDFFFFLVVSTVGRYSKQIPESWAN